MLWPLVLLSLSSIRDCSNGLGRSALLGFESEPAIPKAGDNVTLWVAYDLPPPAITSGTATYSFSLNGIPFPPTVDDLCTQTSCPKTSGFYNESSTDTWPSGISGKIVTKLEWFDANSNLLLCSQVTEKV